MIEALLILFGFILAFIPNWLDRKRKIRSHWRAIRSEISLIGKKGRAYLEHGVKAPLYRFPCKTYDTSYEMLLTEGAILEEEVLVIETFYDLAKDINRGLDQIQGYRSDKDSKEFDAEFQRNLLKVKELIVGTSDAEALLNSAVSLVNKKCDLKLIQY
ncbi:hypothetical protein [Teredinibacter waterburyi]|uniref:hypothetical protein n=1 Tax=Teredinibacter waterburyi TaxID=1500538 RepID=UPI00165EE07C|nr:hypothetical protein [Teredinibacter waterburyi]